jgi:hypothetical protein
MFDVKFQLVFRKFVLKTKLLNFNWFIMHEKYKNSIEISKLIRPLLKEIYECYKKAKENHNSVCTTRSQLLYFVLKYKGFQPKIIRYLTSENKDKRKKFNLLY